MSNEHTPGPWDVVAFGPHRRLRVVAGSTQVATVYSGNADFSYNARLIAACPDLLAALRTLADEVEANAMAGNPASNFWDGVKQARTAIQKATGESA